LKERSVIPIESSRTETTIAVVTTEAEVVDEAEVAIGLMIMPMMDHLPAVVDVEVRVMLPCG
jgi:hypothetical protein